MARLIDAKKLFNDLADYWGIPKDWDGRIEQTCEDALSAIENAPEVEVVEVVHGRWITEPGDFHRIGYPIWCSVCNRLHFVHYPFTLGSLCGCKELFEKPKFCPSCGAVMDGGLYEID